MKKILLSVALGISLIAGQNVQAQKLQIPQKCKLENKQDYQTHEKDVLACINWLERTPLGKEEDTRKEASQFVITWVSGSPYVVLKVSSYVLRLSEVDKEMLLLFMGGGTRYQIQSKDTSSLPTNMAGLQAVMRYYKGDNGAAKNDLMDSLIVMDGQGKLSSWVKTKMFE